MDFFKTHCRMSIPQSQNLRYAPSKSTHRYNRYLPHRVTASPLHTLFPLYFRSILSFNIATTKPPFFFFFFFFFLLPDPGNFLISSTLFPTSSTSPPIFCIHALRKTGAKSHCTSDLLPSTQNTGSFSRRHTSIPADDTYPQISFRTPHPNGRYTERSNLYIVTR